MIAQREPFGTAWRATMYHGAGGLQHRPLDGVPPRQRYTERQRGELLRITDQADALVAKLRHRAVWTGEYDPRITRIAGKAFARLLRRVWLGRQPYVGGGR